MRLHGCAQASVVLGCSLGYFEVGRRHHNVGGVSSAAPFLTIGTVTEADESRFACCGHVLSVFKMKRVCCIKRRHLAEVMFLMNRIFTRVFVGDITTDAASRRHFG